MEKAAYQVDLDRLGDGGGFFVQWAAQGYDQVPDIGRNPHLPGGLQVGRDGGDAAAGPEGGGGRNDVEFPIEAQGFDPTRQQGIAAKDYEIIEKGHPRDQA